MSLCASAGGRARKVTLKQRSALSDRMDTLGLLAILKIGYVSLETIVAILGVTRTIPPMALARSVQEPPLFCATLPPGNS